MKALGKAVLILTVLVVLLSGCSSEKKEKNIEKETVYIMGSLPDWAAVPATPYPVNPCPYGYGWGYQQPNPYGGYMVPPTMEPEGEQDWEVTIREGDVEISVQYRSRDRNPDNSLSSGDREYWKTGGMSGRDR